MPVSLTGTALNGADYQLLSPAQFVFAPGALRHARPQRARRHGGRGVERVTVRLLPATGAVVSTSPLEATAHTVTIAASDAPTVNFTRSSDRVEEGGQVVLGDAFSAVSATDVTVPLLFSSYAWTATPGSDYVVKDPAGNVLAVGQERIVIPAGQLDGSVTIVVVDDVITETKSEWIGVTMGSPDRAGRVLGRITVWRSRATISRRPWSPSPYRAPRATSGLSARCRSPRACRTQRINPWWSPFRLSGEPRRLVRATTTRLSPPVSRSPPDRPRLRRTAIVRVLDDSLSESVETIVLAAGTPPNALLGPASQTRLTVYVADDDPYVNISTTAPTTVGEGQSATVRVTLSQAATQPIRIPFTLTGAAKRPSDYTIPLSPSPTSSGGVVLENAQYTLIIPVGGTQGDIIINSAQDAVIEGDETIKIDLGTPQGALPGARLSQSLKIIDDDFPTVSFDVGTSSSVKEGRTANILVKLSKPIPDKDVIVTFAVDTKKSTAKSGDYSFASIPTMTVTIGAGSSSAILAVPTINDSEYEPTEHLWLTLTKAQNATLGSRKTYDLSIKSDDPAPKITVDEGYVRIPNPSGGTGGGTTTDPQPQPPPPESYAIPGGAIGISTDGSIVQLPPGTVTNLPPNSFIFHGQNPYDSFGTPGTVPVGTVTIGVSYDGPLAGMAIFFDANRNGTVDFLDIDADGIQDENEPSEVWTITNVGGVWGLTIPTEFDRDSNGVIDVSEGQLVAIGGVDTSTGLTREFPLAAPIGSVVVTPLTTIAAALANNHGFSAIDAYTRVAEAFGLRTDLGLWGFDPITGVLSGDPTQGAVFTVGARVQDTVQQVAALMSGVADSPPVATVAGLVFDELAARIASPGSTFDLDEPSLIEALIEGVAARSAIAVDAELIGGASQVIAEGNQALSMLPSTGDLAYLKAVARSQVVAQSLAAGQLASAAAGTTPVANVVAAFTGNARVDLANAAQAGNVVPPALYINDLRLLEGSTGGETVYEFTVSLSIPSTTPVSVEYAALDSIAAVAEGDFLPATGLLTWAAGDNTPRTIQVRVAADVLSEGDEEFLVLLSNPTNAIIWKDFGVGTIVDDDAAVYQAPGDDGPNDLVLIVDAQSLELTRNGEIVLQTTLSGAALTIAAAPGVANTLTIEVLANPGSALDLTFLGAGGPEDRLVFRGGADTVTHSLSGPGTGVVAVAGLNAHYQGIADVAMVDGEIGLLNVTLSNAADDAVIEDDDNPGDGVSRLRSPSGSFVTFTFTNPTGGLAIDTGAGDDTVALDSLDSNFAAPLAITDGTGRDTITIEGFGGAGLSVVGTTVTVVGPMTASGDVALRAHGDLSVDASVTVVGNFLGQAGRSLAVNGNLTSTSGGSLTLTANAGAIAGTVDSHRDAGAAVLNIASSALIRAMGSGDIAITIDEGAGLTHAE
ncbi:MAG: Calx-beta domain-containing protein, partial [Isosphaeraceae bacterium]